MIPEFDIAPELVALAGRWPTYPTTTVHVYGVATTSGPRRVERVAEIRRCCLCHEEVYPAGEGPGSQVLAHLLLSHGYRMDGRQWNSRNELVGRA